MQTISSNVFIASSLLIKPTSTTFFNLRIPCGLPQGDLVKYIKNFRCCEAASPWRNTLWSCHRDSQGEGIFFYWLSWVFDSDFFYTVLFSQLHRTFFRYFTYGTVISNINHKISQDKYKKMRPMIYYTGCSIQSLFYLPVWKLCRDEFLLFWF